jgi:hypothetical protein
MLTEKEKDALIIDLRNELAKWRGRAVEAVEQACLLCRQTDLELCRHCRMEKIRKESGQ